MDTPTALRLLGLADAYLAAARAGLSADWTDPATPALWEMEKSLGARLRAEGVFLHALSTDAEAAAEVAYVVERAGRLAAPLALAA